MNITLTTEKLQEIVNTVSRVVHHNSQNQIMQCIRMSVKGNVCTFVGTNIEMSVTAEIDGELGEDGECAVPARIFLETIKNTRHQKVRCSVKDGVLTLTGVEVKQKNALARITLLPVDDFPITPIHTTEVTHTIPAPLFHNGFSSVLFAVSPSTIKPELACVFVKQLGEMVLFAATDSFRLAEKKTLYRGDDDIPSFLIPGKNAQEFLYFLSLMGENEVLWYFDEKMIALRAGDYYITSRLVVGGFPEYQKIIPNSVTTTVQCITQDLLYILKKASIFSDSTRQISIEIVPEHQECLFRSKNTTIGEFEESIPAHIQGESLGLNFNSKYILDCLLYIHEEGVECRFAGVGKPLVIKGVNNDSFLYLVMPMNR